MLTKKKKMRVLFTWHLDYMKMRRRKKFPYKEMEALFYVFSTLSQSLLCNTQFYGIFIKRLTGECIIKLRTWIFCSEI